MGAANDWLEKLIFFATFTLDLVFIDFIKERVSIIFMTIRKFLRPLGIGNFIV